MKEEKGADLKNYLNEDLKSWYLDEIGSFYLVINDNGKILYFSEDSLNLFSIKGSCEFEDYSISKFIGENNWMLLEEKLKDYPNKEEFLILDEPIDNKINIGVKWKNYKENGEVRYFLIFSTRTDKKEKDKIFFNSHEEALNLLNIAVVIVKNQQIFY